MLNECMSDLGERLNSEAAKFGDDIKVLSVQSIRNAYKNAHKNKSNNSITVALSK